MQVDFRQGDSDKARLNTQPVRAITVFSQANIRQTKKTAF